jgi:transglutaminase/protease-like cytokinesis protein 3
MKNAQKLFGIIVIVAVIGLIMACGGDDGTTMIPVTGVTLNKSSVSMIVGDTETLITTIAPYNATNKTVTWSTSNEAIANVSNGTVTAVTEGTAIITVTTADGNKTKTCSVTVTGGSDGGDGELGESFTSIAAFKTWLDAQPANNAADPYIVKLNVSDLGGGSNADGSVGKALRDNSTKYVNLDLSGSTFTSFPVNDDYSAFYQCTSLTGVTIPNIKDIAENT